MEARATFKKLGRFKTYYKFRFDAVVKGNRLKIEQANLRAYC
jgi:hypothetical protein